MLGHGATLGGKWHGTGLSLGYMFLLLSGVAGDILCTFLSFVIEGSREGETGIVKNRGYFDSRFRIITSVFTATYFGFGPNNSYFSLFFDQSIFSYCARWKVLKKYA